MPVPFICSHTPVAVSYRSCSWLVSHKENRPGGAAESMRRYKHTEVFQGSSRAEKEKNHSFLMSLSHHKKTPEPERCLAEKTDSTGCSAGVLQHKLTAVGETWHFDLHTACSMQ